jgi:small subunit ribosomal protein S20
MPVTVTAKRALRGSTRKALVNKNIIKELEVAIRQAKSSIGRSASGRKSQELIQKASSLADRAAKKKVIHKNKASRIKSAMSKLAKPAGKKKAVKKTSKKVSKKK